MLQPDLTNASVEFVRKEVPYSTETLQSKAEDFFFSAQHIICVPPAPGTYS